LSAGLCQTHWGAYSAPQTPSWIKGVGPLEGRRGEGRGEEDPERNGERGRRKMGKEGRRREGQGGAVRGMGKREKGNGEGRGKEK